jgi:hypothetical protein
MKRLRPVQLPRVMVLVYEPRLTHCVWSDFWHRKRSLEGLLKCLRGEVKAGRFSAYRFITIHQETYGYDQQN